MAQEACKRLMSCELCVQRSSIRKQQKNSKRQICLVKKTCQANKALAEAVSSQRSSNCERSSLFTPRTYIYTIHICISIVCVGLPGRTDFRSKWRDFLILRNNLERSRRTKFNSNQLQYFKNYVCMFVCAEFMHNFMLVS